MIRYLIFLLFTIYSHTVVSQITISGLSSNWDDSFSEWTIFGFDGDKEIEGELRLKWPLRSNWTEWVIDNLDEVRIQIKQKYPNNTDLWELRSGNDIVTIQTKWRKDITSWRIKYDKHNITWRTEYANDLNYWYFEDDKLGFLEMFTIYPNDVRDWEIVDQTIEDVPLIVKIACVFVTSYFSSPKK